MLWLALGLLIAVPGFSVYAQQFGPIVKIPIDKVREHYNNPHENGKGKSCGVKLYGEWPVYLNYTNRTSYRIFTPGLQSTPNPQNSVPPGGRFRFYCYFNGVDGPNNDAICPDKIGEQHPDWYVEVQRRGPFAAFKSIGADPTQPGLWSFASRSTDPEGDPVTEQWAFGDGGTASGTIVSHRYTLPGSYTLYLTATDSDTLTNRASTTVVVPAPKLSVSLVLLNKHPLNQIEIEEEFDVRLDVQASADGVGPLSELVFTSTNVLNIPSQFQILRSSSETNIAALQPGQVQSFTWTLKATNAGKFALVASGVRGKDAVERTVTGVGETELGEVTSLIVGVTQIPPILKLGADNNGDGKTNDLDNILQMVVGITNVSKADVVDVETSNLNDPIKFTSLAETINVWVIPDVVPLGYFGTIHPGAENAVLRTNTYIASDKTFAEARIVLHGKAGDAAVGAAGTGILNVGGGKLVEARFKIQNRPYQAGQPVRVIGSLKNVSRYRDRNGGVVDEGKTVGVMFNPEIVGNGALGYVVPADFGGRTPVGPVPIRLAPGDSMEISAIIATAMVTNQETSLTLTYSALGYVYEEGQKPRRTRPGEIEMVLDSEGGWSPQHTVKLAGLQPTPTWEPCSLDLPTLPYLDCRLRDGLTSTGGALKDLVFLGKSLAEDGVGVITENTLKLAAFEIWLMQQTWDAIEDPAAQARLDQEVAIDIQALKDFGYEGLQGVEVGLDSVGLAVHRSIQNTKRNFTNGNYKVIAGDVAQFVGENPDLPFEALAGLRSLKRLLLLRHGEESIAKIALRESLEKQRAKLPGDVEEFAAKNGGSLDDLAESDVMPNGVEVGDQPRIYRDGMGTSTAEVGLFKKISKYYRVIIAWRARSAKALEYLKAGTHLLKPHGVSIKTVSEIDWKYLGYPEKFLAECVLVEPPIPWIPKDAPQYQSVIDNFLDRFPDLNGGDEASQQLRLQVEERLKFQMDEYPKQIANFQQYLSDGIDTNFKAYKQFEPGSKQEKLSKLLLPDRKKNFRRAEVDLDVFDDPYTGQPRVYYRLKMETKQGSGIFKPITGDIDVIAILNLDGSVPSFLKRVLIYKELIRHGMQHGESFTFLFDEKMRAKFLRCCTPKALGGDGGTMLAATPFGQVLTTQFFDNLSLVEGGANNALAVGKDPFAFLAGVTSAMGKEIPEQLGTLEALNRVSREAAPYVSASALARMVEELKAEVSRENGTPLRMGADGQPETYSPTSEPQSPVLRSVGALPAISRSGRVSPADATTVALEAELGRLVTLGWQPVRTMQPAGSAGGQWSPVTVDQARNGPAGQGVKIAPYTYITRDLPSGTLELPVLSATDLGLASQSEFFAVGDQVVIDPGGPTEEFATLVSTMPFTLNRPLQFLKEGGTTVLFLRGMGDARSLPGALPAQSNLLVWLRADAGLSLTNGTNVISWTDQSRNGFVFSAPSAARRPTWVTNVVNGQPALHFASSQLVGNLGRTLTNATIFSLCRFTGGGSSTYLYAFGTRNFSGLMMTLARLSADGAYHYDGAAERVADNIIPGGDFRVFSQVFGEGGPDRHRLAVNADTVLDTRTTTGRAYSAIATNVVLGSYIAGGLYFPGDLVEWLVYDRVLSVEERLDVEEYLRQRAGLPAFFAPGSLDLSRSKTVQFDVTTDPDTAWNLDMANREVGSALAADPSLLVSPLTVSNQVIRTRLSAGAGTGAMGMMFGFQDPGHFHLFDWRQVATTHPDWGVAPAGMRLRSFHLPEGEDPTGADLWNGPDANRVTTWLTNDIPWVAGREYDLELRLEPEQVVVTIRDGEAVLNSWTLSRAELGDTSGHFGHYVHALPDARFGPVVLPGALPVITGLELGPDGNWTVDWANGLAPYVLQSRPDLRSDEWEDLAPATFNQSQTVTPTGDTQLFRVRATGVTP